MPIAALRILAHTLRDYVGHVVKVSGVFGSCSLNIITTHLNVIIWHSAGVLYQGCTIEWGIIEYQIFNRPGVAGAVL